MGAPLVPSEIELRFETLKKHKGNITYAARELGLSRRTLGQFAQKYERRDQFTSYADIHGPQEPPTRSKGRLKAVTSETPPEGPIRTVVAIGDVHDKPGRCKKRLRWISRLIAERKPDNVVQIGDFITLDSLSAHDPVGSVRYYERPTYAADLESFQEALAELNSEGWYTEIPADITMGNHEYRADRAENQSPNLVGTIKLPIEQEWARYRWRTHPYGGWLFLEGVGFTHIPFNGMGRDYRGKNPENMIGNDAVFSIVFGHTHKQSYKSFPKIGPQQGVDICNLGTALPYGVVEDYASLSTTGWTWGVKVLKLQAGRITGHEFISMTELETLYD